MSASPEVELLAWAAGRGVGPAPLERVRWERLGAAADWQGVAPLLWDALRRADAVDALPAPVADHLRARFREVTARNLHLENELRRVVAVLADASIPVVLLKGAALLHGAYEHPGLRPMADLDVLVRPADAARAQAALGQLGYRQRGGELVAVDPADRLAEHHHQYPMVGPGLAAVELHHRSLKLGAAAGDEVLWGSVREAGPTPGLLVPCPEDLFATVASHFVLDRRDGRPSALRQVADLRRAGDLVADWDRVVEQSRRWGIGAQVHLAAETARRVAGLAVPEGLAALRGAGTTDEAVERFLATRVLLDGSVLPAADVATQRVRRLFPGRAGLEHHIRPHEEAAPSVARLRARRARHLARRAVRELSRPRPLRTDLEVSRWLSELLEGPRP